MKSKVGVFIFLVFLLSTCGAPVATESEMMIQHTQTISPVITLTHSVRSTSTIDKLQEASGGFPFCQASPQKARLGSSVNISAFRLPPNRPISVFIYYDSNHSIQLPSNTIMTDDNGYVNIDIIVPAELPTEVWSRIGLIAQGPLGPLAAASCGVWPWTELSLATYSARQTEVRAPTLTPPAEQAAVTATQRALHNKLDKYCIYNDQAMGFRFSPDGQWVEVFCSQDTIEVVRIDETKNWEVSSDTLINPYTEYFGGVNHWSNDGAYAYITFDPHTDGYWEPFHQGIVLYRLNLETGQLSDVLPLGKSDWIFYSFAFSPNDRRLSYMVTDQSPVVLKMRDMQTGAEQSFEFDLKYDTGGGFVWSPDSQKLVFSVTQFDISTYEFISTSIILWDKDKAELTELIKDHQSRMQVIEWVNQTKIRLEADIFEPTKIKTQNYELDLTNNQLTEIGP